MCEEGGPGASGNSMRRGQKGWSPGAGIAGAPSNLIQHNCETEIAATTMQAMGQVGGYDAGTMGNRKFKP